jgi:hypothetical protein
MRRLITFSGAPYEATTRVIAGWTQGVDAVTVYDDRWLTEQDFYRQNAWLWAHPHKRGFGWYAWKPFIIWHALSRMSDGDIVLYVDADTVPVADLGVLFETCARDGGIMLFASENHQQFEWCKADCYVVMGQPSMRHQPLQAGVARFMLFQKGPWRTTQFLMEWLTYCVNPFANTFEPSGLLEERQGFIEHRAEQAILTNLAHKYDLKLYREACEAGNNTPRDQDLYGQLFRQIDPDNRHVSAEPEGSTFCNA